MAVSQFDFLSTSLEAEKSDLNVLNSPSKIEDQSDRQGVNLIPAFPQHNSRKLLS